ncbi:MAG TPA: class I SAM-dependent methyltransferase [Candidatus Diapherotrites archaeon]|uniref:Class I SAM-dependent methyltransferase n=1 Tax=Candidatus Iainarchaeum sp. TaxID=3101447 RepID=A0A7J4IYQ1_9ARCH|nr:class I SAM-dependent methyltransferase [Candidatus Diapherotrites archaeon]
MRKDLKAIRIADKGYAFYAFELCKKTGIIKELEKKPRTIDELSKKLKLKNKRMLEAMLDFLVGKKAIKFDGQQYSLTGYIPLPFSLAEQDFVTTQYKGAEDWTLFFYGFAEDSLHYGSKHERTGFDDQQAIELWDSVMVGPLYSLRQIAVKKLLKGLKGGEKIIDYGCGSGTAITEIIERSEKPLEIIGVDISSKMLKMAEQRVKIIKREDIKVKLLKKDLSKKFYFELLFDCAFASILINHIPQNERENFYRKVAENLKPNGKFVLFQLVNRTKFDRIFSDWLLNVVPSHHGFPILNEYISQIKKYFSKVEVLLNGTIVIAYK